MTTEDSKYAKVIGVNPLYLIFNKVNEYFQEINENKYLTLISNNESKRKKLKNEEVGSKIRDLIRLKLKNQMIMMKSI